MQKIRFVFICLATIVFFTAFSHASDEEKTPLQRPAQEQQQTKENRIPEEKSSNTSNNSTAKEPNSESIPSTGGSKKTPESSKKAISPPTKAASPSKKPMPPHEANAARKGMFASPPKLKADEFAIFMNEKYNVFKTKKYEGLELAESCFKDKDNDKETIPTCQAYEFAQIQPNNLKVKIQGQNNMAAIHCEAVHGRNLLALDSGNNHHNFCKFTDNSLVNAWTMHFKHFPESKMATLPMPTSSK